MKTSSLYTVEKRLLADLIPVVLAELFLVSSTETSEPDFTRRLKCWSIASLNFQRLRAVTLLCSDKSRS